LDLSHARFDRLVTLIYDTLDDPAAWRTVLTCLHDALGGRAVHLLAFDACHGALSYSDGADMAPQIDLEYIQKYQFLDPRIGKLRLQAPNQWMHCHEHFDDQFAASDPFYQEFLIPHGARYISACKVLDNDDATVILGMIRRPSDGPLPADAVAFLDRLLPHLNRACRMGMAQFVYSTQALVGHALVDRLHQPVMLLTPDGEVVLANEAARRLLESTSLVRLENGRLVLPERDRAAFFDQCAQLEQALRGQPEGVAADRPFHALHMVGGSGAAQDVLYGFFTLLAPERTMGSFGMRSLIMLFFYHPTSVQTIDTSLLTAAFGLSHAECRVASLLAEGMAPKSIADTLGVQYDTVRKQLLSIYQKTATNRQPELMRLLLQLPAMAVRQVVETTTKPEA